MVRKNYNSREVKKEPKEEAKADDSMEEEEGGPVPLVTHVNNILHSVFSKVEVYINNQQIYNSNGLYAHNSYISNDFNGAISEYNEVLHCEVYGQEEFLYENMAALLLLSQSFFTRRMKKLRRPGGLMMYEKMGVEFFSTSELL